MRPLRGEGRSPIIILLVIVIVIVIVLAIIWLAFMQPEDEPQDEDLASLAECTADCMSEFQDVFDAMLALLRNVDNPSAQPWPGVVYSNYTGIFSLDRGDGVWLNGTVRAGLGASLPLGLEVGQSAAARWNRTDRSQITASGGFGFTELSTGKFRMTLIENTTIHGDYGWIAFTSYGVHTDLAQAQAGHPYQSVFVSSIEFETHRGASILTGMMSVGYEWLFVSGSYGGEAYQFQIGLDDFQVEFT